MHFAPHTPDPLRLAKEAQQMARMGGDEGKHYQRLAMVAMTVMAGAMVVQAITPIVRATLKGVSGPDWEQKYHELERSGRGR